ncbi:MAG: hypothetical protein NTX32_01625, partial [Candidatus Firestonebacteria bacterium]|nr:hypothetical protein [Candidatus Firestonebacteria bacterium]
MQTKAKPKNKTENFKRLLKKHTRLSVLAIITFQLLFAGNALGADRFWKGGTDDAWSGTNWATTSGGLTGNSISNADIAIFDSSSTSNCTIAPTNVSPVGISIASAYTGTINCATAFTGAFSSHFNQNGGTFNVYTTSAFITNSARIVKVSGTNATLKFLGSGLMVKNGIVQTAGMIKIGDGVIFEYDTSSASSTIGGGVFVSTSLTTVTQNSASYPMIVNGTANVSIGGRLSYRGGISLNSASATINFGDSAYIHHPNTVTSCISIGAGTINAGGSTISIYNGNFYNSGGTFNGDKSTVIMSGSVNSTFSTITGSNTFYNLRNVAKKHLTFENGKTTTINGLLELAGNSNTLGLTIRSMSAGNQFTIVKNGRSDCGQYLNILDSNNTGIPINARTSTNLGNNTGWTFNSLSAPTITAVTPSGSFNNSAARTLTISGTGFSEGATLGVTISANGGTALTIPSSGVTDVLISGVIMPAGIATGTYDITVTAGGGASTTGTGKITIVAGNPPTVSGVTPAGGFDNTASRLLTLSGTDFTAASTVTVNGVQLTMPAAENVNAITISGLTLPSGIATGTYNITVTNAYGSGVGTNLITITTPAPTVSSVTP